MRTISWLRVVVLLLALWIVPGGKVQAGALTEAQVTQIVRDVQLLPAASAPRAAVLRDEVRDGTALRTGTESRAELTFTDSTLARVGANSIFSFTGGTRRMELQDGAMLLRVPKNAGGASITTAAVTAAITGTTVMLEFHPHSYVKFVVLEGTGRVFIPGHMGESVLVQAGQMMIAKPNANRLPEPVTVDVKKIMKTARLISGFRKLASVPLIAQVEAKQDQQRATGELRETNLAIYGGGTDVVLDDPTHIRDLASAASAPTPVPTPPQPPPVPTEFGRPETIGSPNPYVLNANTRIDTGYTITANGRTDYGKIYRGRTSDGSRSAWLFRGTSAFDDRSGFNLDYPSAFDLNDMAAFKFARLQLTADPILVSEPGGPANLALIGVNGITSGGSGAVLSFSGRDTVLLATENGSITLGKELTFQGIPNLFLYARGAGSNLTLNSAVTGSTRLQLNSEGNLQVNGSISTDEFGAMMAGDFLQGTGRIEARNVAIESTGGDIVFNFRNFTTSGAVISLNAAGTLTLLPPASGFSDDLISGAANEIDFNAASPTTFGVVNGGTLTLTAGTGGIQASNITFVQPNLLLHSGGDIHLFGAQIPAVHGGQTLSGTIEANGSIINSTMLETSTLSAGGNIASGSIYAGEIMAGGNITTHDSLRALGGSIVAGGNIGSSAGTVELLPSASGAAGRISAGGSLFAGEGLLTPVQSIVSVGRNITAPLIVAGTLHAAGRITLDNSSNFSSAGLLATNISAGTGLFFINCFRIAPIYVGNGNDAFSPRPLVISTPVLSSSGPAIPILFANGLDANTSGVSRPGSGGEVTLSITRSGLSIGPTGDLSSIIADGGGYNRAGPFTGGDGGNVSVAALGNISVDAPVEATTGLFSSSAFHGAGGSVRLNSSTGSVAVNSRIQASSADAVSSRPARRSAAGGSIALQSGKSSGVAIHVANTGQLLSLLDAAAPGPGGKITILATGPSSSINVDGQAEADRGSIDIRHTGASGAVNLGTGGTSAMSLRGDVIKAAALGNNGTLSIGRGAISADTMLQLYAPGANGTINFVANVSLSGAGSKIIAGNTVNIYNGVVVNIGGNAPASVFTNHPNYSGFGGNGSRTGTFAGRGATAPQPLSKAPPLLPPGG